MPLLTRAHTVHDLYTCGSRSAYARHGQKCTICNPWSGEGKGVGCGWKGQSGWPACDGDRAIGRNVHRQSRSHRSGGQERHCGAMYCCVTRRKQQTRGIAKNGKNNSTNQTTLKPTMLLPNSQNMYMNDIDQAWYPRTVKHYSAASERLQAVSHEEVLYQSHIVLISSGGSKLRRRDSYSTSASCNSPITLSLAIVVSL